MIIVPGRDVGGGDDEEAMIELDTACGDSNVDA